MSFTPIFYRWFDMKSTMIEDYQYVMMEIYRHPKLVFFDFQKWGAIGKTTNILIIFGFYIFIIFFVIFYVSNTKLLVCTHVDIGPILPMGSSYLHHVGDPHKAQKIVHVIAMI